MYIPSAKFCTHPVTSDSVRFYHYNGTCNTSDIVVPSPKRLLVRHVVERFRKMTRIMKNLSELAVNDSNNK